MPDRLSRLETWVYRVAWLLVIPLLLTVQLNVVPLVFMGVIWALTFVGIMLCIAIEQLQWT